LVGSGAWKLVGLYGAISLTFKRLRNKPFNSGNTFYNGSTYGCIAAIDGNAIRFIETK